jgi:hypothetical protein
MEDFVFEANIAHYKELLATDTDPRKIATLRKLLAEEEAKLADSHRKNSSSGRDYPFES